MLTAVQVGAALAQGVEAEVQAEQAILAGEVQAELLLETLTVSLLEGLEVVFITLLLTLY
jgi:hypothetical protein